MLINQTGLFCAAAALCAALYVHAMQRLTPFLHRKLGKPPRGWAGFPLFVIMVGLIFLELFIVQRFAPDLVQPIGGATFIGLAIGKLVPVPGGSRFPFGIGANTNDNSNETFDSHHHGSQDSGHGDGGNGHSGHGDSGYGDSGDGDSGSVDGGH